MNPNPNPVQPSPPDKPTITHRNNPRIRHRQADGKHQPASRAQQQPPHGPQRSSPQTRRRAQQGTKRGKAGWRKCRKPERREGRTTTGSASIRGGSSAGARRRKRQAREAASGERRAAAWEAGSVEHGKARAARRERQGESGKARAARRERQARAEDGRRREGQVRRHGGAGGDDPSAVQPTKRIPHIDQSKIQHSTTGSNSTLSRRRQPPQTRSTHRRGPGSACTLT
jgi:hypothetical protein